MSLAVDFWTPLNSRTVEREDRIQKEGGGLIPSDPFC